MTILTGVSASEKGVLSEKSDCSVTLLNGQDEKDAVVITGKDESKPRPLPPDSHWMRVALVLMFFGLVGTLVFAGLRCFILRPNLSNREGVPDGTIALADFGPDVVPPLPIAGPGQRPPQPMDVVVRPAFTFEDSSRLIRDLVTPPEVPTQHDVPTSEGKQPIEASTPGKTENGDADQKPRFWGVMHRTGIRIVNGQVVSRWDETRPIGDAPGFDVSEIQPDLPLAAPGDAEPGENPASLLERAQWWMNAMMKRAQEDFGFTNELGPKMT